MTHANTDDVILVNPFSAFVFKQSVTSDLINAAVALDDQKVSRQKPELSVLFGSDLKSFNFREIQKSTLNVSDC